MNKTEQETHFSEKTIKFRSHIIYKFFGPFNLPRRLLKGWHLLPFHPVDFENKRIQNINSTELLISVILILICKFQIVPRALGFEVEDSKFFSRSLKTCLIILSIDFTINELFWPYFFFLN